jgi:hypothetical protein
MRKSILFAAVAGTLASAAAGAANVDLYVSGASAQRTFWQKDMVTSVCGANAQTTFTITGAAANPDNQAYRCTAGAATLPTGIVAGDVVTLHYSAELGSIWGIVPFIPGHSTTRLFVDPDAVPGDPGTACPAPVGNASACVIGTYDVKTENSTPAAGKTTVLVPHVPDVGVTDLDPVKWNISDNWVDATYTALGALPTTAQLQTFQGNAKVVNGQVFSVIVNNAGPAATKGNLSKASLTAIFTGQYTTWGQVPEVGSADPTPIKVCRRDHGSGTQVGGSIFFTGTECGVSGASPFVSIGAPGNVGVVQEDNTTGKLRTCVGGTTGAIGIASLSISGSYKTLNIDDVQANAHNAAAGFYPYAFEDWTFDNTTASGASAAAKGFFTSLFNNARRAANLPAIELGSQLANGQWDVGGNTPQANFALPGGGFGNTKSVASWAMTTRATTGLGFRGGDNCKLLINNNGS